MRRLAATVLLVLAAAAPALGQPARERALADLGRADDVTARRSAVHQLAEHGVMADLPALAAALRDPDPQVRGVVESAMWSVWSRSGHEDVDRLFARGVEQMSQDQLDAAVETFTRVIQRQPDFAEGWNKRATVHYLMGNFAASVADIRRTLALEPRHFGALSGMGLIFDAMGNGSAAIKVWEKALEINPHMPTILERIRRLRSKSGGERT